MQTMGNGTNLNAACVHYMALKESMRNESPDELEWYENGNLAGLHYKSITLDKYLRLFYNVVWSSGFRAQIVFDKQDAYFEVLYAHLFPGGRYEQSNEREFLEAVAPVLDRDRKNKAIVHVVRLIDELGWENFKEQYISPNPGLRARLLELPMIGVKNVKLLLNQTGICDTAKDDIWVTRFAEMHGFTDPLKCVRMISERVRDSQTLIDAVLFWAGRKHDLCEAGA